MDLGTSKGAYYNDMYKLVRISISVISKYDSEVLEVFLKKIP